MSKTMDASIKKMKSGSPTIRPTRGRVLVRQRDSDKISEGGVHLPDLAQQRNMFATVLAVGGPEIREDGTEVPAEVEIGDVIVLPDKDYSGAKVEHQGVELKILNANEIMGFIPKGEL